MPQLDALNTKSSIANTNYFLLFSSANTWGVTANTVYRSAITLPNLKLTANNMSSSIVSAAHIVNYTITANKIANSVFTPYASNTYLQSTLGGYVRTSQLSANLANYVTTTSLTANLANYGPLASNNTWTGTNQFPTLYLNERASDPADPAEGKSVIWQSNGTGTGDDGDIIIKVTANNVTKTLILVDFSGI